MNTLDEVRGKASAIRKRNRHRKRPDLDIEQLAYLITVLTREIEKREQKHPNSPDPFV